MYVYCFYILQFNSLLSSSICRYPDVAVTVADARFMKPLDQDMIRKLAHETDVLGMYVSSYPYKHMFKHILISMILYSNIFMYIYAYVSVNWPMRLMF
jgi:hypothetical protein